MSINAKTRTDWFRLGIEGVVIIISILLAFALQAWWDDRQESETEHDMLVALSSELQGALNMLDGQLDLHILQADSAKSIADNMVAAGEGATILVNDHEIATLFNYATYDPPFGISSALLESGQASILSNSNLRAALGRWPAAIADGLEDQLMVMQISRDRIEPLIQQSLSNMRSVYASNIDEQIARDSSLAILDGESDLEATRELWNLLYLRHARLKVTIGDLERTRAQLNELITLVEQELE